MFEFKTLFNNHTPPLAERMRPKNLEQFVGQNNLVSKHSSLYKSILNDNFGNIIFWGPPGSGKTTLAQIVAQKTERKFVGFNASFNGIKDIKDIISKAKIQLAAGHKNTILFVDEIHRFNKSQQDAFLQPLEKGTILLIGATTENPSFQINSALLSRCSVYVLDPLQDEDIEKIIVNCIQDKENGLGMLNVEVDPDAQKLLINLSNGDARVALNILELSAQEIKNKTNKILTKDIIQSAASTRRISCDRNGEEHYNLISALHKSMRGSDPQAALYWLARMIEGGADPLYIARRLVRFASEDIGLADPQALVQAVAAKDAIHFIGYPECDVALAQCVIFLSTAAKSNSAYTAIKKAKEAVRQTRNEPVPLHIRNAPTTLMKNLDYGKGYQYDHNKENNFSGQSFLPESLGNTKFYTPGNLGFERDIGKRIEYWRRLKQ
jgi:putative ATPase